MLLTMFVLLLLGKRKSPVKLFLKWLLQGCVPPETAQKGLLGVGRRD